MTSGGFTAAYKELIPVCEAQIGEKIVSAYGSSMGPAPEAIPNRLARDEPADVIILAAGALDGLIEAGEAEPGSRVDLVHIEDRHVGEGRGAEARHFDRRRAGEDTDGRRVDRLLGERQRHLSLRGAFPKLDPSGQIMAKSKEIVGERVGAVVARGEAELGFQQVSELLPIEGADFVGTIPDEVQKVTTFSAGIAAGSENPEAARELIACLGSPEAAPVIEKTGLEPVSTN